MTDMHMAASLLSRLKGLLMDDMKCGKALMISPCKDIHTYGMKGPIDVVFIDGQGRVVRSCRNVPKRRRMRCPGSVAVVERFASAEAWPCEGDRLVFAWRGEGPYSDDAGLRIEEHRAKGVHDENLSDLSGPFVR